MEAMRLNAKQGFLDFSKRRVNNYEILTMFTVNINGKWSKLDWMVKSYLALGRITNKSIF